MGVVPVGVTVGVVPVVDIEDEGVPVWVVPVGVGVGVAVVGGDVPVVPVDVGVGDAVVGVGVGISLHVQHCGDGSSTFS